MNENKGTIVLCDRDVIQGLVKWEGVIVQCGTQIGMIPIQHDM